MRLPAVEVQTWTVFVLAWRAIEPAGRCVRSGSVDDEIVTGSYRAFCRGLGLRLGMEPILDLRHRALAGTTNLTRSALPAMIGKFRSSLINILIGVGAVIGVAVLFLAAESLFR